MLISATHYETWAHLRTSEPRWEAAFTASIRCSICRNSELRAVQHRTVKPGLTPEASATPARLLRASLHAAVRRPTQNNPECPFSPNTGALITLECIGGTGSAKASFQPAARTVGAVSKTGALSVAKRPPQRVMFPSCGTVSLRARVLAGHFEPNTFFFEPGSRPS